MEKGTKCSDQGGPTKRNVSYQSLLILSPTIGVRARLDFDWGWGVGSDHVA